jgi:hypothetical protein
MRGIGRGCPPPLCRSVELDVFPESSLHHNQHRRRRQRALVARSFRSLAPTPPKKEMRQLELILEYLRNVRRP